VAIAPVQSTKKVTGGSASSTLAFGANVAAGNLLIVSVASWSATVSNLNTPTDTLTHTYAPVTAQQQSTGTQNKLRSWYIHNSSGGADTVTYGVSAGTADLTCVISEWSGEDTSAAPLDKTNVATGSSTTPSAGATGTLAQADELIYACGAHDGADTTWTEDTTDGFSLLQENEGGTSNMPIAVQYKIVSSSTTITPDWTLGASRGWFGHVGTFKAASGGVTDPFPVAYRKLQPPNRRTLFAR
jgi:hypothetical protein